MQPVRLVDLGAVPPVRSQSCYHAAAYALQPEGPDSIILVSPTTPYVCVGCHQDAEQEVELDYCRAQGLPVYRREVGGGAVLLDGDQIFVQWVFRPVSLPGALEERFRLFVEPLVSTYRALGVNAYLRPVNDVHVGGRKIGGTGAARIGEAEVVVGSLMLDFDRSTMARVLKVPVEKMRDKIVQNLEQYMTTLREQMGAVPERTDLVARYAAECARALGRPVEPGAWSAREESVALNLDARFASPQWLFEQQAAREQGAKIHADVHVVTAAYKAPGGLIRATLSLHGERIAGLELSGDFTLLPRSGLRALERGAEGAEARPESLEHCLSTVYAELRIDSPGIQPADFAAAILQAAATRRE